MRAHTVTRNVRISPVDDSGEESGDGSDRRAHAQLTCTSQTCTLYTHLLHMLNDPSPHHCSDARNEDLGDGSGDEPDEPDDLATGTKQKRVAQPEEQEQELSAYERQRNVNVHLNRGVLEGLGLADSALSLGRKAKAPAKKRARHEAPGKKSARESTHIGEEPPRPRSTRLAGSDRPNYAQDLLGSDEGEEE